MSFTGFSAKEKKQGCANVNVYFSILQTIFFSIDLIYLVVFSKVRKEIETKRKEKKMKIEKISKEKERNIYKDNNL